MQLNGGWMARSIQGFGESPSAICQKEPSWSSLGPRGQQIRAVLFGLSACWREAILGPVWVVALLFACQHDPAAGYLHTDAGYGIATICRAPAGCWVEANTEILPFLCGLWAPCRGTGDQLLVGAPSPAARIQPIGCSFKRAAFGASWPGCLAAATRGPLVGQPLQTGALSITGSPPSPLLPMCADLHCTALHGRSEGWDRLLPASRRCFRRDQPLPAGAVQ